MTSPTEVIDPARRGEAPPGWRVFTKRRNPAGAFFRGSRGDPDPMLVITTGAAVEYVSEKAPLAVLHFGHVAQAKLRARASASTTSDGTIARATLCIWVDVTLTDGSTVKWQTASFRNRVRVMQRFCEGCAVYAFWQHVAVGGTPGGQAG